ncbi:MAG TPA: GNAT family N-acetyltransferase [Phycicoccus sp.]|nr:GNAT family N-acetyltransferase [Phycicoccus sp.]
MRAVAALRQSVPVTRLDLPSGIRCRALTLADVDDVFHVLAAAEVEDAGVLALERSDIEADWSRPSTDLARDTVGLFDGERLLGMAEVSSGGRRAESAVTPTQRGRGLGAWLAGWAEDRAAELGAPRVGQTVPEGSSPHRFLEARGYRLAHTSWVLELPPGAAIPHRDVPDGYRMLTADTDALQRGAHAVIDTAFGEWSDRAGQSFEDWAAGTVRRSDFAPWMLRVVEDAEGSVVGACFTRLDSAGCAFVGQVGVDREHRGRGIAQALLADGFANARARGAERSELSTDSRTGALDLYLKVGMRVAATWVHLATDLPRPTATP